MRVLALSRSKTAPQGILPRGEGRHTENLRGASYLTDLALPGM
jgi:hypothetical protein